METTTDTPTTDAPTTAVTELAPPRIRPRSVKTASRLSDFGLGHIYCGHFVRGLAIYVIGMVIVTVWIIMIAMMKGRFIQAFVMGAIPATAHWLYAKFDARRLAARAPADYALKEYNRWYVYAMLVVLTVLLAVCGAFFIREKAYEAFKVVTDRMSPTIRDGQRVLVNKTIYDVDPMRRGDVVIVRSPNRLRVALVQRLAALPGDKIEIRGRDVLVNGQPVVRPGAVPSSQPATQSAGKVVELALPPGHGYFTSDNPDASLDSRDLGDLGEAPLSNVVGRVEYIYWPPLSRVR